MTTAEEAGGKAISLRPISLTVLIASVSLAASAYADSPNFIFILVDDLGYTDINCPGDGSALDTTYYKTPNIAKLRANGMRFTNAYVDSPFCKPTRSSIMTGKYNQRLKVFHPIGRLPLCETTIAEALDAGGIDYLSASVGKWSISKPSSPPQPRDALPNRQGFDYNYGGSGRLFPDIYKEGRFEKADGTDGWDPNCYPGLGDPNNDPCLDEYLTDSITTRAIEFMHTAVEANTPKPFLLYLAYYSVHWPIQAKQQDINDVINEWNDPNDPIDPDDPNPDPNNPSDKIKYAAMIKNLDDNVGRILDEVNDLGIAGDTIIIFYSDDGGEGQFTSNRPLYSDKGGLYEGGIRVPLIIKWPGHTTDGSTCHKPVSSIDFFPTILDIVYGAGYTAGRYPVIDGLSLAGLLDDPNDPDFTRDTLYWSHFANDELTGVREGDFKLIKFIPYDSNSYYELYRLYDANGDNITECPTADFGCDPCDSNDPNCLDCPQANNLYDDANYSEERQALETKLNNWLDSFKPYEQSDPNTPDCNITEAISNAENGDTIILPPARFREKIDITKQITIRSEEPDNPAIVAATVIDRPCSLVGPTVTISSDNCTLEGVTITRRTPCTQNGAGIQSDGKSATITKCIIRDNKTAAGKDGGAIYNVAGTISNCTIINNSAGNHGGAIANCTADIKNCLIANNSAAGNGGGLYNCSGDIINNTIASNAAQSGGGLSNSTAATITNCIIFSNEPNQLHDSNIPDYSCITGWTTGGTDNISSDPNFISFHNLTDKTTGLSSFNTIKVADANEDKYEVNDIIEYDNDGIARTVTGVNTDANIVTFKPQRAFTSEPNIVIYNWGPAVDNVHENYHIDPNSVLPSPCVDAGDPAGGDYYGQTDIDGDQRVMTEKVDIGADEAAYFPSCDPCYSQWRSVGRPSCWCNPRHCHGNSDNAREGTAKGGYYYVGVQDLQMVFDNWQVIEPPKGSGIVVVGEPNICADVSHSKEGTAKGGYYRVGVYDLQVMFNNWQILEPPKGSGIPPDCLIRTEGKQGAGSPGKDYSTEEMIALLEEIWENDDLVRNLINEQDWQKVIDSLKKEI